jgi:hypothetical protein
MKKEINFDHSANSLADALGVDKHSFALQLASVMAIYDSSDETKVSKLSELITYCVDYKIILLIATTQLASLIHEYNNSGNIDELLNNISKN